MKPFYLLIAMIVMVSIINEANADSAKAAKISAFQFTLNQTLKGCELIYASPSKQGHFELQLSPPCHFHRHHDGKLRVMSFDKMEVMLVESSRPDSNYPKDCYTQIQAVRVMDQQVNISQHVAEVATCPPFQWDEQMFSGLFD